MSWQAVRAVLRARIRPAARKLVAVVMAEAADRDGRRIFPGEERLAARTSMSARHVRRHIAALVADRILVRVRRGRDGQRAEFRLNLERLAELDPKSRRTRASASDGREAATGGQTRRTRASALSSFTHPKNIAAKELFAALVAAEGAREDEITKTHRGALNRAVSQLVAVGATADEVSRRAEAYRREFPRIGLTASGLVKHWARLVPVEASPPPPVCQVCGGPTGGDALYCPSHRKEEIA